jgi:hypothetical protein
MIAPKLKPNDVAIFNVFFSEIFPNYSKLSKDTE